MQLETEEPSHGAFSSLGNTLEYLVDMNTLIPANAQRGTVDKTDAGAFAQKNLLDEQSQGDGYLSLKFYETVV